jgi:CDP-glycerol glycerophosphotransferase (TagB/SpsB family)
MAINGKKGVGLNPNTHIHLTDHLAPLCTIMEMPLLLTDEKHGEQVQQLYPEIEILLINWEDFTPQYLISHFDVFFQSELWHRDHFYASFQLLEEEYQKVVRNVHCPHGFSDKIFWLEQAVFEDITLVYGENMLDMFRDQGVIQHLNAYVRTGNYRYPYYRKHQAFFDQLIEEKIFSRFSSQKPVILYAPTCHDKEHTTSFFQSNPIFEKLPSDYNLVVKIHPELEETDGAALYRIIGKYEKKGQIIFVKDMPLVYPILARADLYIGDMSSIGYDFLAFNRPMFFLNQIRRHSKRDRNLFLYRCGVEIMPEDYENIYSIIESSLPADQERFSDIRSKVYQYTFGEEVPFKELRAVIEQSYFSPKKF